MLSTGFWTADLLMALTMRILKPPWVSFHYMTEQVPIFDIFKVFSTHIKYLCRRKKQVVNMRDFITIIMKESHIWLQQNGKVG